MPTEFEMSFSGWSSRGLLDALAVLAEDSSAKYHDTVHGLKFWFPPSLAQFNSNGWTWARQFVYCDVGLDIVSESSWADCLMAYYAA
jgi:hypothetical protein